MAVRHLILDTDIGTNVDDLLALALALASPEVQVVGVTTVYGDTVLRARIALKLLRLRGMGDIPVAAGARAPLAPHRPIYWAGHEGHGFLEPGDAALLPSDESAVGLIARTVMARPGEVTLVAIGPLTNVALALRREPRLALNLAGLAVMGGVVRGGSAPHLPAAEHNFRSDPEAAQVVLTSGAPLTILPLDVTTQVRICRPDVERIRAAGDDYHRAVADQVLRYPRFAQRGWTYLHDPLAVATLIEPSLVTLVPARVGVEVGDEHAPGRLQAEPPAPDAPATARIAAAVDAPRAARFILDRLAAA